jgi:hypothetical protein
MTHLATGGWGKLVMASAGLIIWASAFVFLYAIQAIGCAVGWNRGALGGFNQLTVILMFVWIAHIVPLLVLVPQQFRSAKSGGQGAQAGFLLWLAFLMTLVGLVATLWVGFPLMVLPPCM